jgi:hypothetical protein
MKISNFAVMLAVLLAGLLIGSRPARADTIGYFIHGNGIYVLSDQTSPLCASIKQFSGWHDALYGSPNDPASSYMQSCWRASGPKEIKGLIQFCVSIEKRWECQPLAERLFRAPQE